MPRVSVTKRLRRRIRNFERALTRIDAIATEGGKTWQSTAQEMSDVARAALAADRKEGET